MAHRCLAIGDCSLCVPQCATRLTSIAVKERELRLSGTQGRLCFRFLANFGYNFGIRLFVIKNRCDIGNGSRRRDECSRLRHTKHRNNPETEKNADECPWSDEVTQSDLLWQFPLTPAAIKSGNSDQRNGVQQPICDAKYHSPPSAMVIFTFCHILGMSDCSPITSAEAGIRNCKRVARVVVR